jgi:hypothetical protein
VDIVHGFLNAFWKENVFLTTMSLIHANDTLLFGSGATQFFKGIDVGDFDLGDYLGIDFKLLIYSGFSLELCTLLGSSTPYSSCFFPLHSFSYWCNICCNRFCLHFADKQTHEANCCEIAETFVS